MDADLDLAMIWYGVLGLFLALYVILDGFTLGVGIVSLMVRNAAHRETLMASLDSVWDANETWLIVFGGALFGAFPSAYATLLHALYIPVMAMLFALIFRGIAFEYRELGAGWRMGFGVGSLVAALAQGYALGALLSGIPATPAVATLWLWLTPFASLAAVGVVFGYALIGATYLILRTEGAVQARARQLARVAAWLTVMAGVGVSLWTPLRFPYVLQRWFNWPDILYLAPLPLTAMVCFVQLLRALRRSQEYAPFAYSLGIFVTSFGGLAVTLYPYILPPTVTLWQAASADATLKFMLLGIGTLTPVMLIYNAYQYSVFRAKIRTGDRHYPS